MAVRLGFFGTALMALHAAPAWGQRQDVRQMMLQAQEDCLMGKTDSGLARSSGACDGTSQICLGGK